MASHSALPFSCAPGLESSWLWRISGAAERVAAGGLLAAFAPLLVVAVLAIMLLSRRPPLIAVERIGQHGRPFWTMKLRTMWPGPRSLRRFGLIEYIVDGEGPWLKCARDARVTSRFARFCRRYSIDELPQLVNVLRGEMSLVGPRPLTAGELKRHYGRDAGEVLRLKPGITGLWQVMGRSHLSYRERRRLDLRFVRERSPRIYVEILLRTVPEVLSGRNSW